MNNQPEAVRYFAEREVWWVAVGQNIRFEEDGKGIKFARPVLVLKKFNRFFFYGITLSTTTRRGKYYFVLGKINKDYVNVALLSQMRAYDTKRLLSRLTILSDNLFRKVKQQLINILK